MVFEGGRMEENTFIIANWLNKKKKQKKGNCPLWQFDDVVGTNTDWDGSAWLYVIVDCVLAWKFATFI